MKIKLNNFEQFFASVSGKENPGTFSITAHLKEPVVPETLQQAVNDLMRRLPFLNVRVKKGFIWYYHEELKTTPQIISEDLFPALCTHFEKGNNHLVRFIYGDRHVVAEAFHTACDGRSLAMLVSALLARYFEIMGAEVQKDNAIDCKGVMDKEEFEDAYSRFADLSKVDPDEFRNAYRNANGNAYKIDYQLAMPRFFVKKFDLSALKSKAKAIGVTISEYIVACICNEIMKERVKDSPQKPISVNIPVDCRGFFPTRSLRPFVSHKIVTMPEADNFTAMAQGIKSQFAEITSNYIQEKINEMEYAARLGRRTPLFIKRWIFDAVSRSMSDGCTTCFSNLGVVKLPKEVEDRVEMLSFALGPEPKMPHLFACATMGNTLTLTATSTAQDTKIIDRVFNALEGK